MDLDFGPPVQQPQRPAVQPPSGTNIFDMFDAPSQPVAHTPPPVRRASLNTGAFDLLGPPMPITNLTSVNTNTQNLGYNSGANQFGFGVGPTQYMPPAPMPPAPMPPAPININFLGSPSIPSSTVTSTNPVGNFDSLPYQKNTFAT